MKSAPYFWGIAILCVILTVFLFLRVVSLERQVGSLGDSRASAQADLKRVQAELGNLREQAPGLGDYMSTIQLHSGKLWFAAKAANWELAEYELGELKETMEAAKGLNAEKNGVKISNVLDSILQTQVAELDKSIKNKSQTEFQNSYDETLGACNGCHTEAGYQFIQIVRPSAPPVTNQKWELSAK